MIRVVCASDLHVDFAQPRIEWPDGDVLIIAGDVANTIGDAVKHIGRAAKHYRYVVYVDGNHESYSNAPQERTIEQTIGRLIALLPSNVAVLGHHRPTVEIEGVHFVGCNGWYSADCVGDVEANKTAWADVMNDQKWIGFGAIEQRMPWDHALDDARLMRDVIGSIDDGKPIVAITHTAPHRDMVLWTHHDLEWDASNAFYVNSHMSKIMEDYGNRITMWVHGHTHYRQDKMINGIYCLANPRGYPSQNPNWEPVVIEVG